MERELSALKKNWNGDESAILIKQKLEEVNHLITSWSEEYSLLTQAADTVLTHFEN